MKKRKTILVFLMILLLAWPYPFPKKIQYLDGGTTEIVSLTYKIVWWNRLIEYEENDPKKANLNHTTVLYLFPNNFKDIETLWDEADK